MSDCCRANLDAKFGEKGARRQLDAFRRSGPSKETRLLIDALLAAQPAGESVLEIGAGLGAVEGALLEAGATHATSVDASSAYIEVARTLANERGYADRVSWREGDFVDVAESIPPAAIVTLDKVICCYPDAERLVALSADRAQRLYGYVVPHDRPIHRSVSKLHNAFRRLTRNEFRSYVHPHTLIEGLLRTRGFRLRAQAATMVWAVRLFER